MSKIGREGEGERLREREEGTRRGVSATTGMATKRTHVHGLGGLTWRGRRGTREWTKTCVRKGRNLRVRCDRKTNGEEETSSPTKTTYAETRWPKKQRRWRVPIPLVMQSVTLEHRKKPTQGEDETEEKQDVEQAVERAEQAVRQGAQAVLLDVSPSEPASSRALFDTIVQCVDRLRGRAALFVADRTDLAAAAGADGVLLNAESGVAPNAARAALNRSLAVAVQAGRIEQAERAVKEGADLVVWKEEWGPSTSATRTAPNNGEELIERVKAVATTVPLIVHAEGGIDLSNFAKVALRRGADGIVLPPGTSSNEVSGVVQAMKGESKGVGMEAGEVFHESQGIEGAAQVQARLEGGGRLVERPVEEEEIIAVEKALLNDMRVMLNEVAPDLPEMGLLEDALQGLDELFLLVVVGEFNAGKSSLINALLGTRALPEGALPTTNEISLLRYPSEEHLPGKDHPLESSGTVQQKDGYFVRFVPAPLLKDVAIVDTPGTNVVLERQQQLTEEFVPRADLVLFVMSADRPFSGSEVKFLRYIREWGKKVVFVLNKKDALRDDELEEVVSFVADNACRLLNVDGARVLPVSCRAALEAKDKVGTDRDALQADPTWTASGFGHFEDFVFDFLGGKQNGAERVRLKLDTPLVIALALLGGAEEKLAAESEFAQRQVEALGAISSQLRSYKDIMEKDSMVQRGQLQKFAEKAIQRIDAMLDEIMQFQNAGVLSRYVFGTGDPNDLPISRRYARDVVGNSPLEVKRLVEDHATWLAENNHGQSESYQEFLEKTRELLASMFPATGGAADIPRTTLCSHFGSSDRAGSASRAASSFDHGVAEAALEDEVREAVLGTFVSSAGALFVGLFSTAFLTGFVQDILGLSVGVLAAYVGLLNIPLRRGEIKRKVRTAVEAYTSSLQEAMKVDFDREVDALLTEVQDAVDPLLSHASMELDRVLEFESRRASFESRLEHLRDRVRRME